MDDIDKLFQSCSMKFIKLRNSLTNLNRYYSKDYDYYGGAIVQDLAHSSCREFQDALDELHREVWSLVPKANSQEEIDRIKSLRAVAKTNSERTITVKFAT